MGHIIIKTKKTKIINFIKLILIIKKYLKFYRKYKPDAIFNLAAETHVDRSIDNPKDFINSNILALLIF